MKFIYVLSEVKGEEFPFNIVCMPEKNLGKQFLEEQVIWLWSFKEELSALKYIQELQNAPILKQVVHENGEVTNENYSGIPKHNYIKYLKAYNSTFMDIHKN